MSSPEFAPAPYAPAEGMRFKKRSLERDADYRTYTRLSDWSSTRKRRIAEFTTVHKQRNLFRYFPMVKKLKEELAGGLTPELCGTIEAIIMVLEIEQPAEFNADKFLFDIGIQRSEPDE